MNLGGPVWHASATAHGKLRVSPETLLNIARAQLNGVGDTALGEWIEYGEVAAHIRRRLSKVEAEQVGPVIDIRQNTKEVARRLAPCRQLGILPLDYRE